MDTLTKWCLESPTPIIREMQTQAHGIGVIYELQEAIRALGASRDHLSITHALYESTIEARAHIETALARLGQKP